MKDETQKAAHSRSYAAVLYDLAHQRYRVPSESKKPRRAVWEIMIKLVLEAAVRGDQKAIKYFRHLQKIARAPVESRNGGWVVVDALVDRAEQELWLDLKFRHGNKPLEKYRELIDAGHSRREALKKTATHFGVLHGLQED